MCGWVFLRVWVFSGRTGVLVRCLGRPALAGSPRDGLGNHPPILCAFASVADHLWDDGTWTGQEEVDGWTE